MAVPNPWDRIRRDLREDEAEAPATIPRKIAKYPVLGEISHTGSSVVYLARDPELNRKLAIKVLREDCVLPDFIRRFKREGEIAASLRHPNIITIHDVGVAPNESGIPVHYIVMDYVEGGTLAGARMHPAEAARILAAAAEAVDHAHRAGIVHRDLKPGNILLDLRGEPIVTDFGLAKSFDRASVHTVQGTLLGTPRYMAPEQLDGAPERIDARSDVYALGAILYEILAGVPPHADPTMAALFEKIRREHPSPPSSRVPAVPRELDAVALKALEKNPRDRYASAGEFAAELRSFLAGQGVRARRVSTIRRILVNRRAGTAAVAVVVGALALAGILGVSRAQRAERIQTLLAQARAWEESGETRKAREGYRQALELDPLNPDARAGFDGTDAELLRPAAAAGGSAETALPALPWVELDGSATDLGISRSKGETEQPTLAIDGRGNLVVAWRDGEARPSDIHLRRWDGKTWNEYLGSATGGGVSNVLGPARFPSVALDAAGRPAVAWSDSSETPSRICFRRWDGTTWKELGRSLAVGPAADKSSPDRGAPSLALDPEGHPVVAWQAGELGKSEVYLSRWDGSSWIELGGSASGAGISRSGGYCGYPQLALDRAGVPTILWMRRDVASSHAAVVRWDGREWKDLDSTRLAARIGHQTHEEYRPALALDPSGSPVVAWLATTAGGGSIHVKRWNGDSWGELGGSAAGSGISEGAEPARFPSIAIDAEGRPVVAWSWQSSGNWEIALRRWTGSAWVELGSSSTGGGISRTDGHSRSPCLGLDAHGNPVVVWVDGTPNRNQIYARRFYEAVPVALRQRSRPDGPPVAAGGTVRGTALTFSAKLSTFVPGATVQLEIEVKPVGTPFTGAPSARSPLVQPGTTAEATAADLAPGRHRWQARTVDSLGMVSPWVRFGGRGEAEADVGVEGRR